MSTLRALAKENGTEFLFGTKVADINPKKSGFEVTTLTEGAQGGYSTFETELLFNCAGLYSDEIAGMVNPENGWEIFPARGEAANFYNTRREELQAGRMNVYPAPFGFFNETGEKAEVSFSEFEKLLNEGKVSKMVGVHLSPTFDETGKVGKTVMVGPGISIGFGKENYKHHHPLDFYVKEVNGFLPQLKEEDLNFHQVGIQAKTKTHYDWVIQRDEKHPNCVQLVGIDSPGLTGSLAIAGYVLDDLLEMEK